MSNRKQTKQSKLRRSCSLRIAAEQPSPTQAGPRSSVLAQNTRQQANEMRTVAVGTDPAHAGVSLTDLRFSIEARQPLRSGLVLHQNGQQVSRLRRVGHTVALVAHVVVAIGRLNLLAAAQLVRAAQQATSRGGRKLRCGTKARAPRALARLCLC